jgi:hypothetical protein
MESFSFKKALHQLLKKSPAGLGLGFFIGLLNRSLLDILFYGNMLQLVDMEDTKVKV